MSTISGYPARSFDPSQKFLVLDPSTQTTALVLGSDLVSYITPSLDVVRTNTTRAAALNEDYEIGTFVQTAGGAAIDDGGNGMYLVVAAGDGDYAMMNGNELLLLPFGTLVGSDLDGALVTDDGVQVTIQSAIAKREVHFSSLESLRASTCTYDYVTVDAANEGGSTGRMELYNDGTTGTPTLTADRFLALSNNALYDAGGFLYRLRKDQEITPYLFGVKWDDSTDDTTNLGYAVSFANTASASVGRITIKCPKGGCRITSLSFAGMTTGLVFEGEDRISSFIRYNNATGNVFDFTGARFVTFRKMQLLPLSSALKTAGHLFHIDNGDDLLFEELRLNSSYEAFYITDTTAASSGIRIREIDAVDYQTAPWNWLIRIHGACSSIKLDNVHLQTSATLTGGGVLVEKNGAAQCDTLRMFRVDVQKFSSGLVPAGIQIEGGDFIDIINSNFEVGGASGRGIKVTGGTNVHLLNNHVTTALIGLEVTDVDGLQVIGGRYYFCQNEGIKVSGGEDITINAVDIFDNGQAAAGTYDGIDAANAAVKDIKITDCQIGSVRGSITTLNNGIDVTGAVGAVLVTDNIIDDACIAGKAVKFSLSGAALPENCLIVSDNGFGPVDVVATHARVRTTDATATTLWSYALADNEHLNIVANVLCQGSSGTNTGGYIRAATVYRDGGSAVIEGSVTAVHSAEYNAGLDCTITVSGNDVRVTVTGIAATTFDWHANVQINGKTSAA